MTQIRYEPETTHPLTWKNVPPTDWGKDHWSTLAFLEGRAVDHKGQIDNRNMRTDPELHPKYVYHDTGRRFPTRLRGGRELEGHDDWSCLEDMIDAGMMVAMMRGKVVWVSFTPFGWAVAGALRAFKARGGVYWDFTRYYFDIEAEGGTDDAQSPDSD